MARPETEKNIKNTIIKNIIQSFITKPSDINSAVKCYEAWEWNGRQSRFIINSLRVYDFFDISWAIPLWDNDLMTFFAIGCRRQIWQKNLYKYTGF